MSMHPGIKLVGIVGLGKMGSGILQVAAQAGYTVKAADREKDLVEDGIRRVEKSLHKMVEKGSLEEEERRRTMERITGVSDLEDLSDCDLIIEAVYEEENLKKALLQWLDKLCPPATLLASNTSTLSITRLSSSLSRRNKTLGIHFFNPVPAMKLVEVVKTVATSPETIETLLHFVKTLGKEPILVRDQAGFLVNYLLTPYLFDAVRALSEGLSTVREIDDGMRLGCGHPMGPLALCDLIGLDILVSAGTTLFEEYHDRKYAAPPLLKKLVELGELGIKTGRGFYEYGTPGKPSPRNFSGV
jgi:3-hydroxybutyryl-CoA dehydrogenase